MLDFTSTKDLSSQFRHSAVIWLDRFTLETLSEQKLQRIVWRNFDTMCMKMPFNIFCIMVFMQVEEGAEGAEGAYE